MAIVDVLYLVLIVAIILITGFAVWNLIDLNKVLKRTQRNLKHTNHILANVEEITAASRGSIKAIANSISTFNDKVLHPILSVSSIVSRLGSLMSIFTANKDNKK